MKLDATAKEIEAHGDEIVFEDAFYVLAQADDQPRIEDGPEEDAESDAAWEAVDTLIGPALRVWEGMLGWMPDPNSPADAYVKALLREAFRRGWNAKADYRPA